MNYYKLTTLLFLSIIAVSCSKDQENIRTLNQKKMFAKNIRAYYDKPIKFLILDSKCKLMHFSFVESAAPFYLDGLSLTFINDVKIFVRIDKFRYESKRKADKLWDINKCILEHASKIELMSDEPIDYKNFKQTVTVEFISMDSIIVRDDFYEFYLNKDKQVTDTLYSLTNEP